MYGCSIEGWYSSGLENKCVIFIPKIGSFWVLADFGSKWGWLAVEWRGWLAPSLAQLLPARRGGTKVFPPLFLGGLTVLGKLSGCGKQALRVVFKMLDRNSQQAFPLLWSVSRGREGKKKRKNPNKTRLALGMVKVHTWTWFTQGYVSVGQATCWPADEILRNKDNTHLPEGSTLLWDCKRLHMGWNREEPRVCVFWELCPLLYACVWVCMCEQEKKSLTCTVYWGFFWLFWFRVFFPQLTLFSPPSLENPLITAVILSLDAVVGTKDLAMFLVLFSTNGLDKKKKKKSENPTLKYCKLLFLLRTPKYPSPHLHLLKPAWTSFSASF